MVTKYGMSLEIGQIIYSQQYGDYSYSEKTAEKIDTEVQRLTTLYHQQTRSLLENNRDKLDILAHALIEKETLHAEEIYPLLGIEPREVHNLIKIRLLNIDKFLHYGTFKNKYISFKKRLHHVESLFSVLKRAARSKFSK